MARISSGARRAGVKQLQRLEPASNRRHLYGQEHRVDRQWDSSGSYKQVGCLA